MPGQGGILAKRSKTVKLSNIQNFTRDMKNVTRGIWNAPRSLDHGEVVACAQAPAGKETEDNGREEEEG